MPQSDIEHQRAERFFDSSKKAQRQLRHAFKRSQLPSSIAVTATLTSCPQRPSMPSALGSSFGALADEDDGQLRRARGVGEDGQRGGVTPSVAVRREQGAERLAQLERLPEVAIGKPCRG